MDRSGRPLKIHAPNTMHHVMVRGNNHQNIFFGRVYYERFLEILREAAEKFNCNVLSYCLMTNHFHLIIQVNEQSLSKIMQNICYRYVRWVHYKLSRVGHLFQGRYRSKLIDTEAYLIYVCRYIHLNPVEARMVCSPYEYPWSSHKYYLFNSAPSWIDISVIKRMICNNTMLTYQEFISNTVEKASWKPAFYFDESGEYIINDEIIKSQQKTVEEMNRAAQQHSMDQIALVVAFECGLEVCVLKSSNRLHHVSYAHALFVYFTLRYTDYKNKDLAEFLNRSPAGISKLRSSINLSNSQELLCKIEVGIGKLKGLAKE